jgi:hypothetical protein
VAIHNSAEIGYHGEGMVPSTDMANKQNILVERDS